MSRVAPNPYSPFADAEPELRHLFPVPAFINAAPEPGRLTATGCNRLAVVPADVVEIAPTDALPDNLCPVCVQTMHADSLPSDRRPVAACHRCLAPTRHDGLCALCRQSMHEHWQAERPTARSQSRTGSALTYREIRREQRPATAKADGEDAP